MARLDLRAPLTAVGVLALGVAVFGPPVVGSADSDLTEAERRGKEIYLSGASPSGRPISAVMGVEKLSLPARAATCGGCHGHDGTGRPESGIIPYNVTWKFLTKSYGHVHEDGLSHGPFTADSLRHYLRTGSYPGGEVGDPSMPLYEISDEDLDDLVAYLIRLGDDVDPGISGSIVTIGTVLPPAGRFGELATAMRQLLEAYVAETNRQGGIYGRELELVVHRLSEDPELAGGVLKTWLAAQQPFALISPFTPQFEELVSEAAAAEEILVVGPWTLYPIDTFSENRHVFYLYSGLAEQARALIRYAAEQLELADPLVALFAAEGTSSALIEEARLACEREGWRVLPRQPYAVQSFDPVAEARRLSESGAEVVLSLAVDRELRGLLDAAASESWGPYVLAPGMLAGDLVVSAPALFEDRLLLAYPTLPRDRTPWGVAALSGLLGDVDSGPSHTQALISAYSAATVFTEAMRRTGRALGRRELTGELEHFYRFETGLTPPITFTNNRRIGASGSYVVRAGAVARAADGAVLESAPWVEVE